MSGTRLSGKQDAFVKTYLSNGQNAAEAYRTAYDTRCSKQRSAEEGLQVLRAPAVAAVIAEAEALADAERALVAQEYALGEKEIFKRWCTIATANPNDLVQHRRGACRYCHGVEHAFQWKTPREFEAAKIEAAVEKEPIPSDEGGYGFRVTDAINPDCPECDGLGTGYVYVVDTRSLSPQARMLYAGTKQTREGLEIKMQDQSKALENAARNLGMFVDRSQLLGKDGKPVDPPGTVMMMDMGDGRGPRTMADIGAEREQRRNGRV